VRLQLRVTVMIVTILLTPLTVYAQDATLSGTVTDASGAVLPGVTVTATHTDSGNRFNAVTDSVGAFRLPLRTGTFRITLELAGFGTLTRTLDLLVGQQAVLTFKMELATQQESVTVTGQAPLLSVSSSTVSGNVDPRQMQDLPVNGRDWMGLSMLVPGNRQNAISTTSDLPVDDAYTKGGTYQINIDGQQITHLTNFGSGGNPKFSRDAIAEFEYVANRFDASQGRTLGIQVNAITKSGTNMYAGSVGGYFRDSKFNAADNVLHQVLPYSDQQVSTTFGGPIIKDRVHFFGNFEGERQPNSLPYTSPYPYFNGILLDLRKEFTGGGRVDIQFTPQTRLAVRADKWSYVDPYQGSGSNVMSAESVQSQNRRSNEVLATLTHVIGDKGLNELKVGHAAMYFDVLSTPLTRFTWPSSLQIPGIPTDIGGPHVILRGFSVGPANTQTPQAFWQGTYSIRDNLSFSYSAAGRHDLRLGGEYLYYPITNVFGNIPFGELTANNAAVPANLQNLFPDLSNANTWNLAPLSPIAISWRQGVGNFSVDTPRYVSAAWVQDDWVMKRLTVNLGLRYDLQLNVFANDSQILPFWPAGRPNDKYNFAPRVGAVYQVNDHTVIRGGAGLYYGEVPTNEAFYAKRDTQSVLLEVVNDGRPDFASNPFNGPAPTYEQALARLCTAANPLATGCTRRAIANGMPDASMVVPHSYQSSIGFQRQLSETMAFTADYNFTGARKLPVLRNINLAYNPTTNSNYPFSNIALRPYPNWGSVGILTPDARNNLNALDTSFTKRFSHKWQLSATYSLAYLKDDSPSAFPGVANLPVDIGGQYGLAVGDQRHRATVNGVWVLPFGLQLSGLYFFGSGQRFATTWGSDLRDMGNVNSGPTVGVSINRLRPDGSIVPRNNFVGKPLHRVDVRLQKQLPITNRLKVDALLEVFNLFNHDNFGSYVTTENTPTLYGQPTYNSNVAYGPRAAQLGFRVTF
jgi:hypothetical protein